MKKLAALFLALLLVALAAGCAGGNSNEGTIEGSLSEIIDRVYETADVDDETRDFVQNRLQTFEIPAENFAYYFFVDDAKYTEAVASEPLINAQAFSICLMRVEDGTDIEALKKEIAENANPRKWICVEVDPADVRVESVGNLVMLIMAEHSEAYAEAFHALAK